MSRARSLRRNSTPHERILWRRLRNRKFAGYKFRPQHPVDRYILDFYCPEVRLAVELDGSGHAHATRQQKDQERTDYFARSGILILPFWNRQIRENLDDVLEAIWIALEERMKNPSP